MIIIVRLLSADFLSNFICVLCFFVGLLSFCLCQHGIELDMVIPIFFTGTVIGYAALGINNFKSNCLLHVKRLKRTMDIQC